jgi:hypothetical protein
MKKLIILLSLFLSFSFSQTAEDILSISPTQYCSSAAEAYVNSNPSIEDMFINKSTTINDQETEFVIEYFSTNLPIYFQPLDRAIQIEYLGEIKHTVAVFITSTDIEGYDFKSTLISAYEGILENNGDFIIHCEFDIKYKPIQVPNVQDTDES